MPLRRSDAPPSLEAANQAQIDDLIRRHRTLENDNKKLSEQIAVEAARSKEALLEIQKQWHAKEKQWCDECDDLLECYRCMYLKALVAVETEKVHVLNEQKILRREKLLRLQRDYRITLFHAKEKELEERIAELEEENEQLIEERRELGNLLRKKFADFLVHLRLKESEKNDLEAERDEMEEDISKLREENAHLRVSMESITSKHERTGLQLEGAQSKRTELEGLNDELKRANHDLQRQLDKWQRLETKGDAELDSLRKRKVELEVEVKELRDRLEKISDDHTRALEKERRRVERMKETTSEWQELAEKHEEEAKAMRQELANLRKAYEMEARDSDAPTAPRRSSKPKNPNQTVSDAEESEAPNRNVPSSKSSRTSKRQKAAASDTQSSPSKAKRKRGMSPVLEEEDDLEEVEPPQKPRADKASPKSKGKAKEKVIEDPAEISDDNSTPVPPPKTRQKRKGANESDSEAQKPIKKGNPKPKIGADEANKRKVNTVPQSKESSNIAGDGDVNDEAPKKKKRKINIFSTAQNGVFDFGVGLNGDGLGIPTSLSPVKEPDGPIPSRAIGGNALSNLGGIIRSRMISRT